MARFSSTSFVDGHSGTNCQTMIFFFRSKGLKLKIYCCSIYYPMIKSLLSNNVISSSSRISFLARSHAVRFGVLLNISIIIIRPHYIYYYFELSPNCQTENMIKYLSRNSNAPKVRKSTLRYEELNATRPSLSFEGTVGSKFEKKEVLSYYLVIMIIST